MRSESNGCCTSLLGYKECKCFELSVGIKSMPGTLLKWSWDLFFFFSFSSPVCFPQSRVSKHRRPGRQGQLRPAGSNSGSQVDQRKHPSLQRRPEESDHFWLWRRSIVRQPAHPLALLRRYVCLLTGVHNHKVIYMHRQRAFHHGVVFAIYVHSPYAFIH